MVFPIPAYAVVYLPASPEICKRVLTKSIGWTSETVMIAAPPAQATLSTRPKALSQPFFSRSSINFSS